MKKVLSFVFAFCALLFTIVGLAMILFDQWYLRGVQSLVTALVLVLATLRMRALADSRTVYEPLQNSLMISGLALLCVGIGRDTVGIWAIGFILFISGFIRSELYTTE